jgi:dihydrofolate reductase
MIAIIAAVAENGVIGSQNSLPWYLPADLKHFAKVTKPHTVIMGRKTYESIVARLGQPLPERHNVVLTQQTNFEAPGVVVVSSVEQALAQAGEKKFVIGGEQIYKLFMPYAEKLYLTEVKANIAGDAKFPDYNQTEWQETARENCERDEKNHYDYSFVIYERRK